jgi:hypothetical protein
MIFIMKAIKYSLIALLALPLYFVNAYSQNVEQKFGLPVDEITGLITYQDVVQTTGNRLELFNRAIGWVNSFYVNPIDATRVRNPESGIIEIVHRFKITNELEDGVKADAGIILYSLKLELRDDRYRYTMSDFVLRQASKFPVERWLDKSDRAYNPNWDSYLGQVDGFALSLVENLVDAMKFVEETGDDEW